MNIRNKINDYIVDKEYKIIIKNNYVNVINYEEIKDFNDNKIEIINKKNNITKIIGENLIISKMQDNEVLIKGKINIATDLHQREEGKIKFKREKDNVGEVGVGFEN